MIARLQALPEWDQTFMVALIRRLKEAHEAALAQHEGQRALVEQMERVMFRARELDPAFAALGDEGTFGQAMAVLKAHGENPGISEEVNEMVLVPALERAMAEGEYLEGYELVEIWREWASFDAEKAEAWFVKNRELFNRALLEGEQTDEDARRQIMRRLQRAISDT